MVQKLQKLGVSQQRLMLCIGKIFSTSHIGIQNAWMRREPRKGANRNDGVQKRVHYHVSAHSFDKFSTKSFFMFSLFKHNPSLLLALQYIFASQYSHWRNECSFATYNSLIFIIPLGQHLHCHEVISANNLIVISL